MRHPWVSVAIKAAITLSLMGWLLHRIDVTPVAARFGQIDMAMAAAAVALMLVQLLLTGWRWATIARVIGAPLARGAALRLTLIGQFFNQTLPSAIGGDAVRAWFVARDGVPLAKAVSGVFADRLVALLLLVAIVAAMLSPLYARVPDAGLQVAATSLVALTGLGAVLLLALGRQASALLQRYRWTRAMARLADDLRTTLTTWPEGMFVAGLSVVVHVAVVASVWLVARGLAIQVSMIDCLVLVPPIVLATTLPISIAGWGVRESATVVGFGFIGVAPADALALSVAFGFVQILIGLPGGIVWMTSKRREVPASLRQKSMQRPPRSQSP